MIAEGQDRCEAALVENTKSNVLHLDEIQQYQDGRYLCAPEACASLFRFEPNRKSHKVQRLPIHLDRQQTVIFEENQAQQAVDAGPRETELTAFFALNQGEGVDGEGRVLANSLLYQDIPRYFRYSKDGWIQRKEPAPDNIKSAWTSQKPVIGRMHECPKKDDELYSLRTLLLHVKGPESFSDLKTVEEQIPQPDGSMRTVTRQCPTFSEAAILRGLKGADDEWDKCLKHARHDHMPGALRSVFASILVHCHPNDPQKLWNDHRKWLWDDRTWETNSAEYDFKAYHSIERIVQKFNSTYTLATTYKIPVPEGSFDEIEQEEQMEYDVAQGEAMLASLKPTQREHYDKIINAVDSGEGHCFFLDGPGGSGKSYLYQTLTHNLRAQHRSVLCVASTGIAATLINGMTAHKQFGIPVPCHENSTSHIRLKSKEAALLREADLIIWDESTMAHKDMLICLDRLLQDVMNNSNEPFGGKCLLLGGDFRQCLPVVPHATSAQQASACLKSCRLWHHFEQLSLTDNIRAEDDPDFAPWLLRVGNGVDGRVVDLDHHNIDLRYSQEDLIRATFGTVINHVTLQHLRRTIILAPTNRTTLELNDMVLNKIPGRSTHRYSIDTPTDNDEAMMPPEILHTLVPPGLPPHDLHLKIGGVYMLLRNMDIRAGLCNGSRFVLLDCTSPFVLKCQLIPPNANGHDEDPYIFYLPRINLTPSNQYPYLFNRLQFPCVPAFAITINKSQGGTFDTVGIDLSTHVFSHGQLYVALSRVKSFRSLRILLPRGQKSTMNQVYSEILDGTHRDVPPPIHAQQQNPDGHYFHEDDSGPAVDQDVIDAEPAHPTMHDNWSSEDEAPQAHSPAANDHDLPAPDESQQQTIPCPVLNPAEQGPRPMLIDPLMVIDSMTYDQRMQMHHALMNHLESQPSTPARSANRNSNPSSATPTPTRRNPPRAARRDDVYMSP
jgi:hypothetical protein